MRCFCRRGFSAGGQERFTRNGCISHAFTYNERPSFCESRLYGWTRPGCCCFTLGRTSVGRCPPDAEPGGDERITVVQVHAPVSHFGEVRWAKDSHRAGFAFKPDVNGACLGCCRLLRSNTQREHQTVQRQKLIVQRQELIVQRHADASLLRPYCLSTQGPVIDRFDL